MDKINQIWPKWHTVELLGRGAYGEVYKVKRELLGETFYSAVKVIRIPKEDGKIRELLSDGHTSQSIQGYYESIARGLMNEIKLLETLKSAENVVTIEEFEVQERTDGIGWEAYIRMELLQNLNEYRAGRQLEEREVVKLGKDICRALVCCEQNQIIHRDIKPSNIFVDEYGHFKLGDFGVARQLEKTQGTLSQKGTAGYMAPELRYGDGRGSYNVDIYSLGLVMYRLLNRNKMPFEPQEKEICSAQEREEALLRRLSGEQLSLPVQAEPALGRIIRKACEFDREKRYQTAREMWEELGKWENSRGALTGTEGRKKVSESRPQEEGVFTKHPGTAGGETEQEAFEQTVHIDGWDQTEGREGGRREETSHKAVLEAGVSSKEAPERKPLGKRGQDVYIQKNLEKREWKVTVTLENGEVRQINVPEKAGRECRICLKGQGLPGENGGENGDLLVTLKLPPEAVMLEGKELGKREAEDPERVEESSYGAPPQYFR